MWDVLRFDVRILFIGSDKHVIPWQVPRHHQAPEKPSGEVSKGAQSQD